MTRNLKLNNHLKLNNQLTLNSVNKPKLKYTFHFTSLITPHKITNIRLLNNTLDPFTSKKYKKLFAKQSYLLMTWLWYIQKNQPSKSKPSFAFKPTKIHKTTLIKSPMAHKTFSQEQFQFKFFNLVISFSTPLPLNYSVPTLNHLLFLILSLKSSIPFVETNFFLLKRFTLVIPTHDVDFLKL